MSRRILLEALLLCALGVVVGLSLNARLLLKVMAGKAPVPAPPTATAPLSEEQAFPIPVSLNEVQELLGSGAVAVDARAAELYAEGHLPGARSLPLGEADERLAAFRERIPPGTVLITYCSGYGCPDSFDLALRLIEEGYPEVRVFEGGLPEWRDSGLPVVVEEP